MYLHNQSETLKPSLTPWKIAILIINLDKLFGETFALKKIGHFYEREYNPKNLIFMLGRLVLELEYFDSVFSCSILVAQSMHHIRVLKIKFFNQEARN